MADVKLAVKETLAFEGGYVNDPDGLVIAMREALDFESSKYIKKICKNDRRLYTCVVPGCNRLGYAKGLCNAHYMRKKKGKRLEYPVRNRQRGDACIDCGQIINKHGGFHRCSKHYKQRRRKILKETIIMAMGGVCNKCNKEFPFYVYDLHHSDGYKKEETFSDMFGRCSLEKIAAEVIKTMLLCANCHREVHYG